jgi:hypothetical protein
MTRVINGIVPNASPPASVQYQKSLRFPVPVMDIPHIYGRPPANPSLPNRALHATRKTTELRILFWKTISRIHYEMGCTGDASPMLKLVNV